MMSGNLKQVLHLVMVQVLRRSKAKIGACRAMNDRTLLIKTFIHQTVAHSHFCLAAGQWHMGAGRWRRYDRDSHTDRQATATAPSWDSSLDALITRPCISTVQSTALESSDLPYLLHALTYGLLYNMHIGNTMLLGDCLA